MKIHSLTLSDVNYVAKIHTASLPNTISSKIGLKYLENLYQVLLSNPKIHIIYIIKDKNALIGLISATNDLNKTERLLKVSFFPKIYLLIFMAIINGRISLKEIVKRQMFEKKLMNIYKKPYLAILTLFVSEDFRRQGLGKKLVKLLIENVKSHRNIYVDTLIVNKVAKKFYISCGFKLDNKIFDSYVLVRKKT